MPDMHEAERGPGRENRGTEPRGTDDAARERLEKDLEGVEEDRSSQRTRGGGLEQFTGPNGQGQQYKP
jgi:hypothetical protein